MALTQEALGAAGMSRGPLGPRLDRAQRRCPRRLRTLRAGPSQPFRGGGETGLDLAQLLLELAGALGRGGPDAVDVEGHWPQLAAQMLETRLELDGPVAEVGVAHGDPLRVAAQVGEQAPGDGALPVAVGEALLGRPAAGADLGEPALDPLAHRARAAGGLLGRGEPVLAEAELLGDHLRPQLQLLALDSGAELGGLRLALQRPQPGARLPLDVEGAVEVVARRLQLQLGAATALAVLAEAGRLLDQHPPLPRLRVDDRLDPALTDHRVHLAAHVGVGEHVDHVDQAATGPVQPVGALAGAVEAALDRDLGEIRRGAALGVVDHHLDLGAAPAADAAAAGRDHVLHRGPPHGPGALFPQRPEHGIGDVRLARAVGPDDHADAGREVQLRPLGEGLEPLQADRFQVHLRSIKARGSVGRESGSVGSTRPGPSAPARRRPARPPSCCARSRAPSPPRRSRRRPRRSGRAAGPAR